MTPESPRRPLIVGNWKLWGTRAQAAEWCERLPQDAEWSAEIGVCPVFTALDACVQKLEGTGVGVYAQNMHQESSGAFTGEVGPAMLTELGVDGVVLGHSERRQYFCETDETTARRAAAALEGGLGVIACVGETLDEREAGETETVLRRQVEAIAAAVPEPPAGLAVAYEPVWAIGTGRTATPDTAQEAHAFVRDLYPVALILYGGSVKPENAEELLAQPDVDGALVGGASLDVVSFAEICRTAARLSRS
jgi:triosephosphate isomerase